MGNQWPWRRLPRQCLVADRHSCEICSSEAFFWAAPSGYHHYRCGMCGHVFVFPVPSQEALNSYYASGQYYERAASEAVRLSSEARARILLLEEFCRRFSIAKDVLDVGCATGIFLAAAVERGFSVAGVESSEETARRARTNVGCEVWSGVLESLKLPRSSFAVVTAWEVIEHALDARVFLQRLIRSTKPGGLIALSTPLADGVPARVLGTRFPMVMPPEHLRLFTRRSISILASEFGLEEVHFSSFSNLNFTALKSGYCKWLFRMPIPEAGIVAVSLSWVLAATTAWLPWVIDRLGVGTEMQIVYRLPPGRAD